MSRKFKRLVSLCLAMVLALNAMTISYASGNNNIRNSKLATTTIADETGTYTVTMEDTVSSRITKMFDEDGNLLETLILDKKEGILTNSKTGVSLQLPEVTKSIAKPCKLFVDKDYEYEFCAIGESRPVSYDYTVAEIIDITTAITAAAVAFVVCALCGVDSFSGSAATKLTSYSKKVVDLYKNGYGDRETNFKTKEVCTEQWESDSSYPGGGFWFLGYMPSKKDFQYSIN